MPTTRRKWGNDDAVCLAAALLEATHLMSDQQMRVRAENGRIVIESTCPMHLTRESWLTGIVAENFISPSMPA